MTNTSSNIKQAEVLRRGKKLAVGDGLTYLCLLRLGAICKSKSSIPNDIKELAVLCGKTPKTMKKLWPHISGEFMIHSVDSGRLILSEPEQNKLKYGKMCDQKILEDIASKGIPVVSGVAQAELIALALKMDMELE